MDDELIEKLAATIKDRMSPEDIADVTQFGTVFTPRMKGEAVKIALMNAVLDVDAITATITSIVHGAWKYREILSEVDPAAVIAVDKYLEDHKED